MVYRWRRGDDGDRTLWTCPLKIGVYHNGYISWKKLQSYWNFCQPPFLLLHTSESVGPFFVTYFSTHFDGFPYTRHSFSSIDVIPNLKAQILLRGGVVNNKPPPSATVANAIFFFLFQMIRMIFYVYKKNVVWGSEDSLKILASRYYKLKYCWMLLFRLSPFIFAGRKDFMEQQQHGFSDSTPRAGSDR